MHEPSTLHAYADRQIRHDVDMLTWLVNVLDADEKNGTLLQFDPRLRQSLYTAAVAHLQALLSFLYGVGSAGSFCAGDYMDEGAWSVARPPLSAALHAASERPITVTMLDPDDEPLPLTTLLSDIKVTMRTFISSARGSAVPGDLLDLL